METQVSPGHFGIVLMFGIFKFSNTFLYIPYARFDREGLARHVLSHSLNTKKRILNLLTLSWVLLWETFTPNFSSPSHDLRTPSLEVIHLEHPHGMQK